MLVSACLFFRDVVPCLKEVIRSWGLPLELYFKPPCYRALLRECIAYHDPELWPSLVVLANDEKDVYRKLGVGGLQDWGDGRTHSCCRRLSSLRWQR